MHRPQFYLIFGRDFLNLHRHNFSCFSAEAYSTNYLLTFLKKIVICQCKANKKSWRWNGFFQNVKCCQELKFKTEIFEQTRLFRNRLLFPAKTKSPNRIYGSPRFQNPQINYMYPQKMPAKTFKIRISHPNQKNI